jgi:hypothetical protein
MQYPICLGCLVGWLGLELYPVGVNLGLLAALGVEIVVATKLFHSFGRAIGNGGCLAIGVDHEILVNSVFPDLFKDKSRFVFFNPVVTVGEFSDFHIAGACVFLHLVKFVACLFIVFVVHNERITDCVI